MVSIPSWQGLHPLVVHFPIALLTVAPILIVVGLLLKRAPAFLGAALLVMALGTSGAWLAVASGDAAAHAAEGTVGLEPLLEQHEEMAETARTLFTVLTLVFGALLAVPLALKTELGRSLRVASYGGLLAVYAGALVYLANTAHQGARLVHEKGVRALVVPGASIANPSAVVRGRSGEEHAERAPDDRRRPLGYTRARSGERNDAH